MPLSIKDPEADRLARTLAARTGETITHAVIAALRERLAREERKEYDDAHTLAADIMDIGRHFAALPIRDARSLETILYDGDGLPS